MEPTEAHGGVGRSGDVSEQFGKAFSKVFLEVSGLQNVVCSQTQASGDGLGWPCRSCERPSVPTPSSRVPQGTAGLLAGVSCVSPLQDEPIALDKQHSRDSTAITHSSYSLPASSYSQDPVYINGSLNYSYRGYGSLGGNLQPPASLQTGNHSNGKWPRAPWHPGRCRGGRGRSHGSRQTRSRHLCHRTGLLCKPPPAPLPGSSACLLGGWLIVALSSAGLFRWHWLREGVSLKKKGNLYQELIINRSGRLSLP